LVVEIDPHPGQRHAQLDQAETVVNRPGGRKLAADQRQAAGSGNRQVAANRLLVGLFDQAFAADDGPRRVDLQVWLQPAGADLVDPVMAGIEPIASTFANRRPGCSWPGSNWLRQWRC
jgi:hypothetical protein